MNGRRGWSATAWLLLTLAPLFWAGNVVIGRAVRGSIAPVSLTFWRWVIALAVLLPLTGKELWAQRRIVRARWQLLGGLGFLSVFAYQTLCYQALTATTALNVLLISATFPLVTALINRLVFRETIAPHLGMAILASVLGVLTVISRGDLHVLVGLRLNRGDLLMLGATVAWAVYSVVLQRHRPKELSPTGLLSVTVLAGMVFVVPFYLWRLGNGERVAPTVPNLMAIAYVGLFASVAAYLCWNEGLAHGGANRAGLFFNLMPVFGAVLAVLFLREVLAVYHVVGAALVFGGIVLGTRRRAATAPAPTG